MQNEVDGNLMIRFPGKVHVIFFPRLFFFFFSFISFVPRLYVIPSLIFDFRCGKQHDSLNFLSQWNQLVFFFDHELLCFIK